VVPPGGALRRIPSLDLVRHLKTPKGSTSLRTRLLTRAALVLSGIATLSFFALGGAGTAQAASAVHYQRGLYVANGWLCRGWANGAYHCTRRWHRDAAGHLISDNPSWVPTSGGAVAARPTAHAKAPAARAAAAPMRGGVRGLAGEPCSPNVPASVWTAVNYRAPGAIPPGCYGGVYSINPANYVYRPYFGECNWWVEVLRPDEPTTPYDGRMPRGSAPRVGATVHFAGGTHGAAAGGHYGHVEAISPDGRWIMTSEMNFYWRGGGFGRVVYRYVPVDSSETFIY
jgi:hypothetical protein